MVHAVDLDNVAIRRDDGNKDLTLASSADSNQEDDDEEEEDDDNSSTTSSTLQCDDNAQDHGGGDGAMVLADAGQDRSPCFQNIEVTNSRDVHFGNKTYYQGPVTIKQILYTNPNGDSLNSDERDNKLPIAGTDNDGYMTDCNSADVVNASNGIVKNGNVSVQINSHNNNSNWTSKSKGKKWLQNLTGKQLIVATAILICLVGSIIGITVILLIKLSDPESISNGSPGSEEEDLNVPNNYPEDPDNNVTMVPKWVDRRMWLASPEISEIAVLETPVPYVIIHHTATMSCRVLADCKAQVLNIQEYDMYSKSFPDIRYNFLIGGDGYIYVGRDWTKQGSHTEGYNNVSIGIAFIGYFEDSLPTTEMLLAAKEVIRVGVKDKYIKRNYTLLGARQLINSTSPGKKLYELIQTWPHWSATL